MNPGVRETNKHIGNLCSHPGFHQPNINKANGNLVERSGQGEEKEEMHRENNVARGTNCDEWKADGDVCGWWINEMGS